MRNLFVVVLVKCEDHISVFCLVPFSFIVDRCVPSVLDVFEQMTYLNKMLSECLVYFYFPVQNTLYGIK